MQKCFTFYFIGRYVPVAMPDDDTKKSRKLAKKLTCARCGKTMFVVYFDFLYLDFFNVATSHGRFLFLLGLFHLKKV